MLLPDDFRWIRDRQKAEGYSTSTLNLTLKVLRAPLARAVKLGHIRTNPTATVDTLPHTRSREEAFTLGQVTDLLGACRRLATASRTARGRGLYRDWEAAILLAYHTGQRQSDIANLQWESVDLEVETITFNQAKSSKQIVIPLPPEILAKLRFLPQNSSNVLPTSPISGFRRRNCGSPLRVTPAPR